jgi:hypothetical protein
MNSVPRGNVSTVADATKICLRLFRGLKSHGYIHTIADATKTSNVLLCKRILNREYPNVASIYLVLSFRFEKGTDDTDQFHRIHRFREMYLETSM